MYLSFRTLGITLACCLLSLSGSAQSVALKSGECYEIRCVELPTSAVIPSPSSPLELSHNGTPGQKSALWRITKLDNGNYTIQHAETGRYMTYDGIRTATRRYMTLTDKPNGTASEWSIYPGSSHIIISNWNSQQLLNVRIGTHIVGLYNNTSKSATSNERFALYTKKGEQVSSIDGQPVVFKPVEHPVLTRQRTTNGNRYYVSNVQTLRFTLDGKSPVYDKRTNTYLFPLPERLMGKEVTLQFACATFPNAQIFVNGKPTSSKGTLALGKVDGTQTYRLAFATETDTLARATLQFTYMPILEITTSGFSKQQWGTGSIIVHDATLKTDSAYAMEVRNRGDFTSRYNKRSMGIKLKGTDGKKINRSLLGLRTDNYWVLNAMTVDPSRMRGRIIMDLWADFAEAPYYSNYVKDAPSVSRGRLAEVFLNGSYHGVYDLCERIDRKQCGLAKGNDIVPGGMLYKADQWSHATQFASALGSWHSASTPSERQEEWSGWQIKYPTPSAKKNAKWQPLVDAIQAVSNSSDAEFCQRIGTLFDLPAVRDYYLLIELIFATDNSAKNMYWAIQDYQRDARLTPIPWDMDGTLGRNYAGSDHTSNATRDYRDFLRREGHQNALFERLYKLDPNDWNAQMAKRYRQLRRTHFNPQRLSERITSLLHLMEQSGAHIREAQRWNNANGLRINIPQEAEFIKAWITRRIAYLDTQYNM